MGNVITTGIAGGLLIPKKAFLLAPLKGLFTDLSPKQNWDCTVLTLSIQPILNQHLIRDPLKGVTQIIVVFAFDRLIDILILYVFTDLRFVQADCADIISASPKAVPSKIPFQSAVFLENNHGALPLEVFRNG